MLPCPSQRLHDLCQDLRVPVWTGDGAGGRFGLLCDPGGLSMLPRPGQHPRDPRQHLRPPVGTGDEAHLSLGLPSDPGGLQVSSCE